MDAINSVAGHNSPHELADFITKLLENWTEFLNGSSTTNKPSTSATTLLPQTNLLLQQTFYFSGFPTNISESNLSRIVGDGGEQLCAEVKFTVKLFDIISLGVNDSSSEIEKKRMKALEVLRHLVFDTEAVENVAMVIKAKQILASDITFVFSKAPFCVSFIEII